MELIVGAHVYTKKGFKVLDLRVGDGVIAEIGYDLVVNSGDKVIDGVGKYLMPGFLDPHVHFRDPGNPEKEDFESGSLAALAGGVTRVFDMPNTNPPTTTRQNLEIKRAAAKKAKCDVKFWIGATYDNLDEIAELINEPDVVGVKAYLGSSTGTLLFDDESYWDRLFSIPDIQIAVHAEKEAIIKANTEKFKDIEDPEIHSVIRSNEAAEAATRRACEVGFKYNTKLHIAHLSTSEELFVIKEYKEKGYTNLTCEVCPHHLIFHTGDYAKYGNFLRVNPPIRSREDRQHLWEDGIGLGLVDMIATDHAPHVKADKECLYHLAHSGMPGVQECASLMLNAVNMGKMSIEKFVELRCVNPGRIFGCHEHLYLKEGSKLNMVMVDLNEPFEIEIGSLKSRCGWSNYEGFTGKGKVVRVWN